MGARNLAQFTNNEAVVDVGDLTLMEKSQILYNHVNFGGQSQSWRTNVKPHLAAVAEVDGFLPGIAERLGDPNFTKGLEPRAASLVRFMKEPREHLVDTVNALDGPLQAALLLVYVHQAGFDPTDHNGAAADAVAELTGYSLTKLQDCFAELKGSFLKLSGTKWTFAHPTISDALTEILRQKPHMMAALIRGATIDTILSSFICEGSPAIRDALVVPSALDDALVDRLGRTPDELQLNWMLFQYLAYRASDAVIAKIVRQYPSVLTRRCWSYDLLARDPRMAAFGRAQRIGVLPSELRERAADELESAVFDDNDISFFEEEEILALLPSLRLAKLGLALRTRVLPSLEARIEQIVEDADLDEEPDSHFKNVLGILDWLEALGVDEDAEVLIEEARDQVRRSVGNLEERKRERDEESGDEIDWAHILSQEREAPAPNDESPKRSIFDDVDK
ncbi:hypothetical protein GCM10011499_18190 [Pelagibacterium lentulum]|uniref:Uncharacterized protein n=1 Tax=Pelagibacterium lentulum TaxID=2029865 RepID=A0A916VXH4_9HYPH|nr:hypothetical protein GCM10011499_18190 [Pelagibacterium lentulum]